MNSIFDPVLLLSRMDFANRYSRKMHHMHFSLFYNCFFLFIENSYFVFMNSIFGAVLLLLQMNFVDRYYRKMQCIVCTINLNFLSSLFYNCLFYLSKIRTNSIFDTVLLLLQMDFVDRYLRKMHRVHFSNYFFLFIEISCMNSIFVSFTCRKFVRIRFSARENLSRGRISSADRSRKTMRSVIYKQILESCIRVIVPAAPSEAGLQKDRNADDKGGKKERQKCWNRRVDECHPSQLIGI